MSNEEIAKVDELIRAAAERRLKSLQAWLSPSQYDQAHDLCNDIIASAVSDIRTFYGIWE